MAEKRPEKIIVLSNPCHESYLRRLFVAPKPADDEDIWQGIADSFYPREKKMAEKKFCDMDSEERFADLKDRVQQFNALQLPGQPGMFHMGTSYLIADLFNEVHREREDD